VNRDLAIDHVLLAAADFAHVRPDLADQGPHRDYRVIALAVRTDAGCDEQPAVAAKGKPARKRHDSRRQNKLAGRIQPAGKRHDLARAAQADIVTAVRPKNAPTGIQSGDRSSIANDLPTRVESHDPIGAAIEEQQPCAILYRKAARIGDASVIAEHAVRPAAVIEG
jgi:hypothetical protein